MTGKPKIIVCGDSLLNNIGAIVGGADQMVSEHHLHLTDAGYVEASKPLAAVARDAPPPRAGRSVGTDGR